MKPKTEGPPDQPASSTGLDRQLTASSHSRKSDYRPVRILIAIPVLFGLWLVITSVNEVIPELVIYNGKRVLELCLISVTLSFLLISGQVRQKLEVILRAIPSWVRVFLLIFFGVRAKFCITYSKSRLSAFRCRNAFLAYFDGGYFGKFQAGGGC